MRVFFTRMEYTSVNLNEKSFQEEEKNEGPVNPHTPVAQKVADEVVFRRFQGEGVEFFEIGPHGPLLKFCCESFGKYLLKPFRLSFFSGFLYHNLF